MKKRSMCSLFFVLLLAGCDAVSSYTPAIIKSSRIELSSVPLLSSAKNSSEAARSEPFISKAFSNAVPKTSSQVGSRVSSNTVSAVTADKNIEVLSLTSPIVRGQEASVAIKGKPDIEYTIKVIYKSGPSSAKGLEPKISEPNGTVTWTWKVSARTSAGNWSIEISGGESSVTVPFIVTE
ncbi:MAG TPA: hypothetical protein PK854_02290 [Oscillospiraceae bacterium]|nr:hypothetical protein [Oscillospiraceae bacterium]HPS34073.1 hypothetical protein [Oscillospiraceae bacterium]